MNKGSSVGIQAIAVGALTGAFLAGAHNAGMANLARAREAREEAAYDAAVANALGDAEALGVVALRIVKELAASRAENLRLTRALAQRQAFIERMRG